MLTDEEPSEPHVKVYIPVYEPLEVSKCDKCGKVIAEHEETSLYNEVKVREHDVRQ